MKDIVKKPVIANISPARLGIGIPCLYWETIPCVPLPCLTLPSWGGNGRPHGALRPSCFESGKEGEGQLDLKQFRI